MHNAASQADDCSSRLVYTLPITLCAVYYVSFFICRNFVIPSFFFFDISLHRSKSANGKPKWYKFNDTIVDEFEMGDAAVEAECFGGSYKPKSYSSTSSKLK